MMDPLESREGWIGRNLSHYPLFEELHRGEVQIVYRARDDKLSREVALKVLPPELVQEPERRQRFVSGAPPSERDARRSHRSRRSHQRHGPLHVPGTGAGREGGPQERRLQLRAPPL